MTFSHIKKHRFYFFITAFIIVTIALQPLATFAVQKPFTLDLGHAYIGWESEHLGLSSTRGRFDDFDGMFLIDDKNFEKSEIEFTVKTHSINSNHIGRDNHLRKADFLDADTYPEIFFTSKKIIMESEKRGKLIGDLTMRGVTAPLELTFTIVGDKEFPQFLPNYDQLRAIGVTAKGTLNRTHHGMNNVSFPGSPVPDEISLDLRFDLIDCEKAPETNVPCHWGRVEGFKGPSE